MNAGARARVKEVLDAELLGLYIGIEEQRNTPEDHATAQAGIIVVRRVAGKIGVRLMPEHDTRAKARSRLIADS